MNEKPTINSFTREVEESCTHDTSVCSAVQTVVRDPFSTSHGVVASDPDCVSGNSVSSLCPKAGTLAYSFTDSSVPFEFGALQNQVNLITVKNAVLDFEAQPVYSLTVRVTDGGSNGANPLSDTATATINILNVNERPNMPSSVCLIVEIVAIVQQ